MTTDSPFKLDGRLPDVVPVHLAVHDLAPDFTVIEAAARCALSQTFELTLTVQHLDPGLKPAALVGRKVRVTLEAEPGKPVITGVIRRFEQTKVEGGAPGYRVTVVPEIWLLSLRRDHRILRDKNVQALALEVVRSVPRLTSELWFDLRRAHRTYEYRVQYGETDLQLLERIAAEDGVAYYFEHFGADAAKESAVVFTDDTTAHAPAPALVLPFAPPGSMSPTTWHVHGVEAVGEAQTGSTVFGDTWFERPAYVPLGNAAAPDASVVDLASYEFAVRTGSTEPELLALAENELAAKRTASVGWTVRGTAFVAPGHRIKIDGGPDSDAEGELLVVSTTSTWTTDVASSVAHRTHESFCVLASRRFVPVRIPKARVHGIQSARVVGDGEIDVDELGRILCAFPWDLAQSATRRVRVSQGWAGPGYGLFTQPRVGDEVLVAYLDGDPDEPIVVGRVHNGTNAHPVALPADKTVSAWRTRSSPGGDGYNEIRMDDRAGEERFDVHAQRDLSARVERDAEVSIGRHTNMNVKGNTAASVQGHGTVGFKESFSVDAKTVAVTGRTELKLSTKHMFLDALYRDDHVAATYNVQAANTYDHVTAEHKFEAGQFHVMSDDIILQAKGSSIRIRPGSIEIQCPGEVIVNGSKIKLNC